MSHFNVAVFSDSMDDVDDLLAPYEEGTNNAMFLKWTPASETIEELTTEFKEKNDDNKNLSQFVKSWYGYDYNPICKNYGYLCNSNAKWDWYEIGGRWENSLRMKDSFEKCNQAKVSDIDFSINKEIYDKACRFWEVVVDGDQIHDDERKEDFESFYNSDFTANSTARRKTTPSPWHHSVSGHLSHQTANGTRMELWTGGVLMMPQWNHVSSLVTSWRSVFRNILIVG